MSLEKWFSQSKWPVPSEERIDMFTGIIEEIGTISGIKKGNESAVLTIACEDVLKDTKIGDLFRLDTAIPDWGALYER